MPDEGFEYIDEDEEVVGKFTCWSETEGGCYLIHEFISETATCYLVGTSQVFEVMEGDVYKLWPIYTYITDMWYLLENEQMDFELSTDEKKYLIDLKIF